MGFSNDQECAIEHTDAPAMVLAGPGSGKTTVITHRILHLIRQGVRPEDILVITFTKAAALGDGGTLSEAVARGADEAEAGGCL